MARRAEFQVPSIYEIRVLRRILFVLAAFSTVVLAAQDSNPTTFHVYVNLLQIPVLVIAPNGASAAPIAESRFAISLDSGPKFRPTHVRLEGEDPIALTVVLDVSGSGRSLMPGIDEAIAALAPLSLHPADRVSFYALGCTLNVARVASTEEVVADQIQLKLGVEAAMRSGPGGGRANARTPCTPKVHLWDALAYVTQQMSERPGRRVILVISDGQDKGSANTWNNLRRFAAASAVSIFGITDDSTSAQHMKAEDIFQSLCQQTGGIVLSANRRTLHDKLKEITDRVRGRYIVEFPRQDRAKAGAHSFLVTIDNSDSLILSSGISVPMADPHVLADPMTVPKNPAAEPEMGDRRVLSQ